MNPQVEASTSLFPSTMLQVGTLLQLPDGRVQACDAGVEQLLGYPADQLIGTTPDQSLWQMIQADGRPIPPEDHPAIVAIKSGQPHQTVMGFYQPSGNLVWLQVDAKPLFQAGKPYAVVVTIQETQTEYDRSKTEWQRTEAVIRQSEARYRALTELSPQIMYVSDPNGRIEYCNQWGLDFTGRSLEQLRGYGWSDLIHPDYRNLTYTAWVDTMQGSGKYELEVPYRRFDGEYRWMYSHASPIRNDRGEIEYWIGIALEIHDRKQAELQVSRQEAEFRQLANAVPQMVWMHDATGKTIYVNDQWTEFSGLTLAESQVPEILQTVFHPEDLEQCFREWAFSLANGTPYCAEARLRHYQTGEYRWFLSRCDPFKDETGKAIRWFGTSTDITDTKRRELHTAFLAEISQELTIDRTEAEMMQVLGEKIGQFFNVSNCAFARFDSSIDIAVIYHDWRRDETAVSLVGEYPVAEFAVPQLWERMVNNQPVVIHNVESDPQTAPFADRYHAINVRAFMNAPFVSEDGIQFAIVLHQSQPYHWRTDEIELLQQLTTRIWAYLERDRMDEELRQKTAILNTINEATAALVYVKDRQGRYVYANPAALEVLGRPATEVVGFCDRELFSESIETIVETDQQVMNSGRVEAIEETVDGIRTFLSVKAPHRNEAGEVIGLIGVSTDISDRVQIERDREQVLQREQAAREAAEQANRIKDEFLAVLSHELRSPLNPILGWTKILRTGNLNPERVAQALETIERNAQLQSELIEDILDVARILQGKLSLNARPVNVVMMIHSAIETVRLAAESKGIAIEIHLSEVGEVSGDATRLQQIVWNLLSNAVKFTPSGGRITVQLDSIDHEARITITDTGKGISPDFLPHVFDYFRQEDGTTTRKFGGLGLGLAIVRHLVELHGGTVAVTSEGEGLGATFTVTLPLINVEATPSKAIEQSNPNDLRGMRLLIVDDDPDSREFIGFVLNQSGAQVTISSSGAEAFSQLTRSRFDVLVSDIGMPDMDGYMLLKQIRQLPAEQGGSVNAIALTAYAGEFNQQQALQAGFQAHLAKPIDPERLVQEVSKLRDRL